MVVVVSDRVNAIIYFTSSILGFSTYSPLMTPGEVESRRNKADGDVPGMAHKTVKRTIQKLELKTELSTVKNSEAGVNFLLFNNTVPTSREQCPLHLRRIR